MPVNLTYTDLHIKSNKIFINLSWLNFDCDVDQNWSNKYNSLNIDIKGFRRIGFNLESICLFPKALLLQLSIYFPYTHKCEVAFTLCHHIKKYKIPIKDNSNYPSISETTKGLIFIELLFGMYQSVLVETFRINPSLDIYL